MKNDNEKEITIDKITYIAIDKKGDCSGCIAAKNKELCAKLPPCCSDFRKNNNAIHWKIKNDTIQTM
jgi:hypothetical protein